MQSMPDSSALVDLTSASFPTLFQKMFMVDVLFVSGAIVVGGGPSLLSHDQAFNLFLDICKNL